MKNQGIASFADFFGAVHRDSAGPPVPYSWQDRLAARAVEGSWPSAIDLPTGSGKTACIDVAIFALAAQATRPVADRNAPRRIFFCVNRRVIVDEAHRRALRIAQRLWEAEEDPASAPPVLNEVAAALRQVAGSTKGDGSPPLDVLELRGGIYRDNRWARSAAQPTVICTTIDQLGSRLLFRGYGVSSNAAPIQAALIAYDSLVLVDEAHISQPFLETLHNVESYLDPKISGAGSIGVRPMIVVPMTATPSKDIAPDDLIRIDDEDRKNESLARRLSARKPASLMRVANVPATLVDHARAQAKAGNAAVGIIVNRVATAREIHRRLREDLPDARVELVIGAMRPIDRDAQSDELAKLVGPGRPPLSEETSIVVATQCLEVGADYDFDILLNECASLDALRQRFGRLNRAGRAIEARAVVVVNDRDVKPDQDLDDDQPLDPIYGNALARTWNWLWDHASEAIPAEVGETKAKRGGKSRTAAEVRTVDFGIDAFGELLKQHTDDGRIPRTLLAPSASLRAPVMFPAHVDVWCQTAPSPVPEPDLELFLHGQHSQPEVQICWRADLVGDIPEERALWCEIVALLPPTAAECMSVTLLQAQRWLARAGEPPIVSDLLEVAGQDTDVAGVLDQGNDRATVRAAVAWRGPGKSIVIQSPEELRPGDTLVLPAEDRGLEELGHIPDVTIHPDVAETAFLRARDRYALRLHPRPIAPVPEEGTVAELLNRVANPDDPPSRKELNDLMLAAAQDPPAERASLREALTYFAKHSYTLEPYPDGDGVVLTARERAWQNTLFSPPVDEGDDETSRIGRELPVSLGAHTGHVVHALRRILEAIPTSIRRQCYELAADRHDWGKADDRFQAFLRGLSRTDAWLSAGSSPVLLGKSDGVPRTPRERNAARERSGLPDRFRHEMLSLQLAERFPLPAQDTAERDLILHLIAAHHGHGRPFAPVVLNDDPPDVEYAGVLLPSAERREWPPHRLDSGVADRFWSLTRRHGWWGLAYLEAILRLADQEASAIEDSRDAEAEGVADADQAAADKVVGAKPHTRREPHSSLPLRGVDGTNPLGFLAALGLLRVLDESSAWGELRMSWTSSGGTWIPVMHASATADLDEPALLAALGARLAGAIEHHPGSLLVELESASASQVARQALLGSIAAGSDRSRKDWTSALASDFASADSINQLQTTRRDYFLGNVKSVISRTKPEHLRRALFQSWDYSDALDNQSLHLDPNEDRRHAYQWNRPAGDPERKVRGGMLGANRLALEAIPLFTSFPESGTLRTVGFSGTRSTDTRWTWPIWRVPLSLPLVRSLLGQAVLQQDPIGPREIASLTAQGVAAVYRTRRILVGKTPNFTPSRCLA